MSICLPLPSKTLRPLLVSRTCSAHTQGPNPAKLGVLRRYKKGWIPPTSAQRPPQLQGTRQAPILHPLAGAGRYSPGQGS